MLRGGASGANRCYVLAHCAPPSVPEFDPNWRQYDKCLFFPPYIVTPTPLVDVGKMLRLVMTYDIMRYLTSQRLLKILVRLKGNKTQNLTSQAPSSLTS